MGPPDNLAHVREWTLEELAQLAKRVGLPLREATWTRAHTQTRTQTTIMMLFSEYDISLPIDEELAHMSLFA